MSRRRALAASVARILLGTTLGIALLSLAVPILPHRCLCRLGNVAYVMLSRIHSAQQEYRGLQVQDGVYGSFTELAAPCGPREVPLLPSSFRVADDAGVVTRGGYRFRLELRRGCDGPAVADGFWVLAWPEDLRDRPPHSRRAFAIDESGVILAHDNAEGRWRGAAGPTSADLGAGGWVPCR